MANNAPLTIKPNGLALVTDLVSNGPWNACYDPVTTGWSACYAPVSTSWTACFAAPVNYQIISTSSALSSGTYTIAWPEYGVSLVMGWNSGSNQIANAFSNLSAFANTGGQGDFFTGPTSFFMRFYFFDYTFFVSGATIFANTTGATFSFGSSNPIGWSLLT